MNTVSKTMPVFYYIKVGMNFEINLYLNFYKYYYV